MHRVFERQLVAKTVAGRYVGAEELGRYVVAYAKLFRERHGFPEARMLLDATAEASNRHAHDTALRAYTSAMEAFFAAGYCTDAALAARMAQAEGAATALFDQVGAAAGRAGARARARLGGADRMHAVTPTKHPPPRPPLPPHSGSWPTLAPRAPSRGCAASWLPRWPPGARATRRATASATR